MLPPPLDMPSRLPSYRTDEPWKFTYSRASAPGQIRFAMAYAGVAPPDLKRCCDLAFGQGLSLILHAACNQTIDWTGTDFNPGHVAFARNLVSDLDLGNLTLHGLSFAEFDEVADVGNFDAVTNVGTWSWLPPEDQAAATNFLKHHLTSHGVFCVAHATLPGQSATDGLRRIFKSLAPSDAGGAAVPAQALHDTLRRTLDFLDCNPSFQDLHWTLRGRVEQLMEASPAALAHEYFNYHFRPEYFSGTAQTLRAAGLSWRCAWQPSDNIARLHITPLQQVFLDHVADAEQREQLRDFVLNRSKRNDIFQRGRQSGRTDQIDLGAGFRFVSVRPWHEFKFAMTGAMGEVALARALYGTILELLSDGRPRALEQIHAHLRHYDRSDVADAMAIMIDADFVHIADASDDRIAMSAATAQALNQRILKLALDGDTIGYLGSPVTGSGISVPREHQLLLLGLMEGQRDAEALARYTLSVLRAGDPALLRRDAEAFLHTYLPIYGALQLVDPESIRLAR